LFVYRYVRGGLGESSGAAFSPITCSLTIRRMIGS
jgi:hypothetical protein